MRGFGGTPEGSLEVVRLDGADDVPAPRLWQTRHQAGQAAAIWRDLPLTARADDGSFTSIVTDPPPADITWQGQRYYLAHLNAHRVIYSQRPPPAEPPDGR